MLSSQELKLVDHAWEHLVYQCDDISLTYLESIDWDWRFADDKCLQMLADELETCFDCYDLARKIRSW